MVALHGVFISDVCDGVAVPIFYRCRYIRTFAAPTFAHY